MHCSSSREAPALPRGHRPGPVTSRLDGVQSALLKLAALPATLAVQLRQHADGRPVRVLGDRPPRLGIPFLVGGFWRVSERLGSPQHASKPAWHPDLAAPRLLLSIGHLEAPFGLSLTLGRRAPVSKTRDEARASRHRPRPREAMAGMLLLAQCDTELAPDWTPLFIPNRDGRLRLRH
jgi:hypothetical protein